MVNISKIEALIEERGWSNSYFCSLLGKNPGWISDMRRGKGLPDENTLKAISDRLDTTVDYLTNKTEQKNKPTAKSDGPKLSESEEKLLLAFRDLDSNGQNMILRAAGIDPDSIPEDR